MSYAFSCIGPDDEPRLRDEHAFLERQLAEVIRLATVADRDGWEMAWAGFTHELEQHMRYEEQLLFPAFAKSRAIASAWMERLRGEHEEIRRQCELLCRGAEEPSLFMAELQRLARLLSAHKEAERLVLYPWLAALSPPLFSWGECHHKLTPHPAPQPWNQIAAPTP